MGDCFEGRNEFIANDSADVTEHAKKRMEDVIAAGDGLYAKPLLPTLHAGVIAPGLSDRFGLATS